MGLFTPLATCGGAASSVLFPMVEQLDSSFALLLIPIGLVIALLPYAAIVVGIRRAGASGEVVLSQRMLKMEGRGAMALPLEEVQDIEVVHEGDRGRLRFTTTRGEIELFDGLFHHELAWLHQTIAAHTDRLRQQLQEIGYDTDVAARPPEAITRLVPS